MVRKLSLLAVALMATPAFAETFVTTIDPGITGSTGTITFNDWGYKGPTGVGANDFQVGAGFDSSRIGQVQHVITRGASSKDLTTGLATTNVDWKTPDAAHTISSDFTSDGAFTNSNMDGGVNFYQWGYSTPAGSTFNNMQIDKAGNYHVAKSDMKFGYYDVFMYKTGAADATTYDTNINFQPYAISDAKGWCGSVLVSNPNSLAKMAGQVTFDFAFDAFLGNEVPGDPTGIAATQIVPGFVMRSYGDYIVDVTAGGDTLQHYTGSAVVNNTDPLTGEVDSAYQNRVSFLGAGVVPLGVWVVNEGTPDMKVVAEGTPGATWHSNAFGGYAFLLRADADRTLEKIDLAGHSDYVTTDATAIAALGAPLSAPVPLPAAAWLLGSGLLGLAGIARRPGKLLEV